MSLDPNNPLMEGLELLLNQSIKTEKIYDLVEKFDF